MVRILLDGHDPYVNDHREEAPLRVWKPMQSPSHSSPSPQRKRDYIDGFVKEFLGASCLAMDLDRECLVLLENGEVVQMSLDSSAFKTGDHVRLHSEQYRIGNFECQPDRVEHLRDQSSKPQKKPEYVDGTVREANWRRHLYLEGRDEYVIRLNDGSEVTIDYFSDSFVRGDRVRLHGSHYAEGNLDCDPDRVELLEFSQERIHDEGWVADEDPSSLFWHDEITKELSSSSPAEKTGAVYRMDKKGNAIIRSGGKRSRGIVLRGSSRLGYNIGDIIAYPTEDNLTPGEHVDFLWRYERLKDRDEKQQKKQHEITTKKEEKITATPVVEPAVVNAQGIDLVFYDERTRDVLILGKWENPYFFRAKKVPFGESAVKIAEKGVISSLDGLQYCISFGEEGIPQVPSERVMRGKYIGSNRACRLRAVNEIGSLGSKDGSKLEALIRNNLPQKEA